MAFETPYVPGGLRWNFCAPEVKIWVGYLPGQGINFEFNSILRNKTSIFE